MYKTAFFGDQQRWGERGCINVRVIVGGCSITKFQNSCPNQQNIQNGPVSNEHVIAGLGSPTKACIEDNSASV
jgi:hypothetical protein